MHNETWNNVMKYVAWQNHMSLTNEHSSSSDKDDETDDQPRLVVADGGHQKMRPAQILTYLANIWAYGEETNMCHHIHMKFSLNNK